MFFTISFTSKRGEKEMENDCYINGQQMPQHALVCESFEQTTSASRNIWVGFQSQGMSWLMQKILH